jgi:hypothetical protein
MTQSPGLKPLAAFGAGVEDASSTQTTPSDILSSSNALKNVVPYTYSCLLIGNAAPRAAITQKSEKLIKEEGGLNAIH